MSENTVPKNCATCEYYDYLDNENSDMGCTIDMDEDEMWHLRSDSHHSCPYYKQYDEYKSVRRQN